MLCNPSGAILLLFSLATIPLSQAQSLSSLPQCVQNCIYEYQYQDDNCSVTNVECLCQASSGAFLPDLISCMHQQCNNDLNMLLAPLQLVCEIAGAPIPGSAISSAENQASSLAAQVTTTVTVSHPNSQPSTPTGGVGATTTVWAVPSSVSTKTVTKSESGSTIYIVYPITVGSTTTSSGAPTTIISVSTQPTVSVVTYETTNSKGKTVTTTSTYHQATSSSSTDSVSSTTTLTTSVQAAQTSSALQSSQVSKTSVGKPEITNSSPFTTTNGNGGSREEVGNWFGLGVLLVVGVLWI